MHEKILPQQSKPMRKQAQNRHNSDMKTSIGVKVFVLYPFAGASTHRWVSLRCLSDGAHHQLDQSTLLSVCQHFRGNTDTKTTERQTNRRRKGKMKLSAEKTNTRFYFTSSG